MSEGQDSPLQRAEREVQQLRETKTPPPFAPHGDPGRDRPITWDEQAEGAKLYLLETRVNWWDVDKADHVAILEREVDVHGMQPLMIRAILGNAEMDHEAGLTATKPPAERPDWQTIAEVAAEEMAGAAEDLQVMDRAYHHGLDPAEALDRHWRENPPARGKSRGPEI